MLEELIVRCEGWILALIALCLVYFFPLGLIFLFFRKLRRVGVAFLCVSVLFFGLCIRDVYANLHCGRPWMPSLDDLLPELIGIGDTDTSIASIPFNSDRMEFDVVFVRRGPYYFGMVTNERQKNDFKITEKLSVRCRFMDENGVESFVCSDKHDVSDSWGDFGSWQCGGSRSYGGRFYVSRDLLYDKKYRVVVEVSGETEAFRKRYPDVHFVIVKEWK